MKVASVVWRRRDAHPENKAIILTDSAGWVLKRHVSTPVVEQHRGVVVFTPHPTPQIYYLYYMPYTQSGVGHAKTTWTPPAPKHGFTPAGSFTAQPGLHTRQIFVLPRPVTGTTFEWTCVSTYGSNPAWQGFLVEISFRTSDGVWLRNHATRADPSPVTSATSWQPNGRGGGNAWQVRSYLLAIYRLF